MEVALGRRQLRVAEEALDPARIGLPRDQRAGAVSQRVELEHAQPNGRGSPFEPPAQRTRVEGPTEARAEDEVLRGDEVLTRRERRERVRGWVGDRHKTCLPGLRRAFDPCAECAVNHEPAVCEIDIYPAEREQLVES